MTEKKSKCPFAMFSALGQKMSVFGGGTAHPHGHSPDSVESVPFAQAAKSPVQGLNDEALALRTLLMHASVVRGKMGNLLILPSISLPSGDISDAPAAIRSWLGKVKNAD